MKKYIIGPISPISPIRLISPIGLILLTAAVLVSLAVVFSFAKAELAEGVTQEQLDSALKDLSQVYGQDVTHEQAKEICNQDKYAADCAEIGKRHNLFEEERLAQVDVILDEIKGQVADQIKSCQTIECLVGVAEGLASRVSQKDPTLARQIDLTPKVVQEKKQIVEAAKSIGLTIDQCIGMDPDTADVEVLRGCARLAKEDKVKKYLPAEIRANVDTIAEETERTVQLKQALSGGQFQCGNNTLEGCGNFCLNPSTEARAAGASAIPEVCKQIAQKFFGPQGVGELEKAYSKVSGVADYYYKKAQNFVFTTLDGRTLTSPEQIGQYMEQQGKAGNVEAVSKGMDFMITQGFATQADKDFALKMVSKFREKGGVADFDACSQNPKACRDLIHDDFQGSFEVMEQVFEIMRAEIGFDPNLCEQGGFDPSIGQKCLEGGKRALPKIEALAATNPQVQFIVQDIKSHLDRGDQLSQKKDQFRAGTFSGPGGCRDERECFTYCSNSANGPECIAFGAKEGLSGFKGEEAARKYQQYEYNLNRPAIEEEFIKRGGVPSPAPVVDGYGPFQPPYGDYGRPYYPPYQSPGPRPDQTRGITGDHGFGPSPECLRAITSGDFVAAKQVCNVPIGGPGPGPGFPPPFPTNPPICPLSPYVECPAGQYHDSFRNEDGCFVDGPCKPIPTYSPGPYPTYSPGPYPTGPYPTGPYPSGPYPSPGGKPQCSDGLDNDNDGQTDYPADTSCYGPDDFDEYYPPPGVSPGPTYSPGPGGSSCSKSLISLLGDGCHQMYTDSTGRAIFCDGPMTKSAKEGDTAATPGCSGVGGPGPYPTYSPYPSPGTCPAGYHYHGEQGGFCMNDREDYSATCFSADGKSQIKCPSQQTGQCTSPQWWDPARGYCVGSTSPSPYPTPSGGATCPAGYHYHSDSGGFCMNDREDYAGTCYTADGKTTTTCPKPTYSPYPSPSAGGCPPGSHSMSSYCMSDADSTKCGPFNSSSVSSFGSCSSYQTTATWTPAPNCPSGQWWDYANNYCRTDCGSGAFWDPAQNKCVPSAGGTFSPSPGATTYTPLPGTTTYTPAPSCPAGQWWDSATSSCHSTTSATYTPYVGYCGDNVCSSSETSSSCPSDCGAYAPTYSPTSATYTPYPTTQYTPYPTTEYIPPPSTYSPPPSTYSPPPPPPTSGNLYNHLATLHCAGLGRAWDGQYCQPEGTLARAIENTWAALGRLIGF